MFTSSSPRFRPTLLAWKPRRETCRKRGVQGGGFGAASASLANDGRPRLDCPISFDDQSRHCVADIAIRSMVRNRARNAAHSAFRNSDALLPKVRRVIAFSIPARLGFRGKQVPRLLWATVIPTARRHWRCGLYPCSRPFRVSRHHRRTRLRSAAELIEHQSLSGSDELLRPIVGF
jgi:hypothetical protein